MRAGARLFYAVQTEGELKFRVADTRYDDNAGNYEVDVLIIPEGAVPPATRVGEAGTPSQMDVATALIIAMKSDLRNMVSAEESFFADSGRYTQSLAAIHYTFTSGVKLASLNTGNG